ncbi:MAG: Spy/CpxP family protein refolding chaperone [Pyrinomonadaceae bacterium]|nr:Spy/CpxP family protein refolding chaperone [Pyrinomonadaceae bacterium]
MKKFNYAILIFTFLLLTATFSTVRAQDTIAPNDALQPNPNQKRRPNLLAELDLSTDQIQQIRRINRENQPLRREAQSRLREANKNLDAAIYADKADETEIQNKLKAAQIAQSEVIKIRSTTELAVRKILTPAQLVKFREIRGRFMERMENLPQSRRNRPLNSPNPAAY